jgi:thiamine biosynthesis lipoprotein
VASTRPSRRSRPKLPPSLRFEAIGTAWQIDTPEPIGADLDHALQARIDAFDRTWSRFRDDSVVADIARRPGNWRLPPDAGPLFELYRRLYAATDGRLSPLVGQRLVDLGYDRAYTLRPTGRTTPVPAWDDVLAWDGQVLSTVRPVVLDVGAAGKGYLVDILGGVLVDHGVTEFTIDASGDILRRGPGAIRVGLEHPLDPSLAIGVVNLGDGSICGSASNRRAWGDELHHVVDAITGLPTRAVIATWAMAGTALEADGIATALFFADPSRLADEFEYSYVRMNRDSTVEFSPGLDGELFE